MSNSQDCLFLLEVLVEKVSFLKVPCTDRGFRTCVTIQCSAVPTIEISDDDPGACVAKDGSPFTTHLNVGKSCLFSMKEGDIKAAMSKFLIEVSVNKSLPCDCMPGTIYMGSAVIDMTKEFIEARNTYLVDSKAVSHQALKDSFRLIDGDDREQGTIDMFLRISCFGSLIMTKFQGGAGGALKLGGDSKTYDRSCNPSRGFQTLQDPCACGVCRKAKESGRPGGTCPLGHQGPGGAVCPSDDGPYAEMPCQNPDDPCYCTGPKPGPKLTMACRNTDPYCLHLPKDCCPPGNKVIFQMPGVACGPMTPVGPLHKHRAHFTFTSDGVGDVTREEQGQLLPTTAEDYPGVVYDYPKDVIKLRIGKTVEMPGRKTRMEYQFVTPIVQEQKKIPRTDTRPAQCNRPCSSGGCSSCGGGGCNCCCYVDRCI